MITRGPGLKGLKLNRFNFFTKTCEEVLLSEDIEERVYHLELVAIEGNADIDIDRLKEVFVIALNRKELIYLTRHHTIN